MDEVVIQGSSEWAVWRNGGVGASEVPAILGVCPYNTPYGVWAVKAGLSKGFEGNSFTRHGQETEGRARARYELITMEDMPPACATHPIYAVCRASLDGLRADNKLVLEIKCPKGAETIGAAKAGKVVDHYWPQVQYQLAVTGADLLHFFVYHEETKEHALVEVKPDLAFQGEIIAKVLHFWNTYVLTKTPPPLTERDVKIVDGAEINQLCDLILKYKDSAPKKNIDSWKALAVKLGGHPKIKCGRVQVGTVNRNGKFSYHKLTISEENA